MNIQVDPTRSNLASAMLNSKIRPRAVVGYGVKIFSPSPPSYVTRSPGMTQWSIVDLSHIWLGPLERAKSCEYAFFYRCRYCSVLWQGNVSCLCSGISWGWSTPQSSSSVVHKIRRDDSYSWTLTFRVVVCPLISLWQMRLAWPNISKGLIIVKSMLTEVKSFELYSRIEQFFRY